MVFKLSVRSNLCKFLKKCDSSGMKLNFKINQISKILIKGLNFLNYTIQVKIEKYLIQYKTDKS